MEYQGQQFRFETVTRISNGGFGEVHLGRRVDDHSVRVAIKVPLRQLANDEIDVFLREAAAAERVPGPNIVKVIDWGDQPPFIALEFMEEGTLDRELRTRAGGQQFWTTGKLLSLYRQLAEAMSAINQHVIHRDLKPENIFIDGDTVKVADFGLAKYADESTRPQTFKGWGSYPYLAPETIRETSVDWKADQYSLGIVFYEMATLERPFVGTNDELVKQHLYKRPPLVTSRVSALPDRLASLVARMLEKERDRRFASWDDLITELSAITAAIPDKVGQSASDPLVRKAAEQIERLSSQRLEEQRAKEDRRRRWDEREDLLDYWSNEFVGQYETRFKRINEALGTESAFKVERETPKRGLGTASGARFVFERSLRAQFHNSGVGVLLGAVSIDGPREFLLWGRISLVTNRRCFVTNLLLSVDPSPYGTWYQVDMKMSGFALHGGIQEPKIRAGGKYQVIGRDKLVVATTWGELLAQRDLRNTMSDVDYTESVLDFDEMMEEILTIFIEDAMEPDPLEKP